MGWRGAQGRGEAGWSSSERAVLAPCACGCHPACSLLTPAGPPSFLTHFKLILLMLPSFILLSLSVYLSLCLVHHVCDSYPVNSQRLTCPCCQPKFWRRSSLLHPEGCCGGPKPEQVSAVRGFSVDNNKGKACQAPYISPVPSEGCHQALSYAFPEFTLAVALVLYLPTLFPATSLLD